MSGGERAWSLLLSIATYVLSVALLVLGFGLPFASIVSFLEGEVSRQSGILWMVVSLVASVGALYGFWKLGPFRARLFRMACSGIRE